jgi:hypothetical protein
MLGLVRNYGKRDESECVHGMNELTDKHNESFQNYYEIVIYSFVEKENNMTTLELIHCIHDLSYIYCKLEHALY